MSSRPRGGSGLPRAVDVVFAATVLIVTLPLTAAIAIAVATTSRGPIIHRAQRVAAGGGTFKVFKFRTMEAGAERHGPGITAAGDDRITRVGAWLRRTKLDELPQLFNVLRGDMALVGPRPEDPRYVAHYSDEHRWLLALRPGITSPASVAYRHEERLLATFDPELTYVTEVLPAKLQLELEYFRRRSVKGDLSILLRTFVAVTTANRA